MMKWFWKINYLLTIYSLLVVSFVFIPNSAFIEENSKLFDSITLNMVLFFPAMIIEWLQFPLCLIVIIFWKEQRFTKHFIYVGLLVVSNIAKWILWFWAVGQATYTS